TPLNSLLILAEILSDNPEGNLSEKQREFAQTIYSSGSDLLALINDILDMAKIESGTMAVEVSELPFPDLKDYVERTFRRAAKGHNPDFRARSRKAFPRAISPDPKRLQQGLPNWLSNAFKFTEEGRVVLRMSPATEGWSADQTALNQAESVIALAI